MADASPPWYDPQGIDRLLKDETLAQPPAGTPEGTAPITQADGSTAYETVPVVVDL